MADPLDPLFKALESINEELSGLHIRLARVEDQQSISGAGGPGGAEGEGRPPGTPIVWRKLEDPERSDLWVEFTGWVFDIADQFELTVDQLPRDCWWLHGGVVEELTALWTSHRSAFEIKDDSGASVYLWHDAFARALDRISRSWLGECTNGYHQPRSRERWGTDAKLRATIIGAGPPPGRRGPGPENPDLLAS